MLPLSPQFNTNITVSGSSQAFTIPANINSYSSLEIKNNSGLVVFVASNIASAVATTSSYAVLPGVTCVITIPNNHQSVAIISSGAGGVCYFTVGGGI